MLQKVGALRLTLIVFIVVMLTILAFVVLIRSSKTDSASSTDLNEEPVFVIAPSNGILKNNYVRAGEEVETDDPLVQINDATYENRLRDARVNVVEARLRFEEARLESSPSPQTRNARPDDAQLDAKRKEQEQLALKNQQQFKDAIADNVKRAEAKLADLQSRPFNLQANAKALEEQQAELAKYQAQLDVANEKLKKMQLAINQSEVISSETFRGDSFSESSRRLVGTAEEALRQAEVELEALSNDEQNWSTIVPAPCNGIVVQPLCKKGRYVRAGQALVILQPNN